MAQLATQASRGPNEKLTITEVCWELKISRSTFYEWRASAAPRAASPSPRAACASAAPTSTADSAPMRTQPDGHHLRRPRLQDRGLLRHSGHSRTGQLTQPAQARSIAAGRLT
jgi:hypothetical protein